MHLSPRKSLNKAFLKVKPNRSEIERFKVNLIQLLDRTNDTESEEFHKNRNPPANYILLIWPRWFWFACMKIKVNWTEQIQKWEASGMNKLAFCKQESLHYQSFLYHTKRRIQQEEKGSFQQLRIGAGVVDDKIDYFFCDGRRVSFPVSTSKEMIRFVLSL